jgi:hypothetical protein
MRSRRFFLSIDLGKVHDPTALAFIEQRFDRACTALGPVYDVGNVLRWPLGTNYLDIVGQMADLIYRNPCFEGAYLPIDYGGVGRGIYESFVRELIQRRRLPVTLLPVQITTGSSQTYNEQDGSYNVAKKILISTALMAMNEGRLLFAKQAEEIEIIKDELRTYEEKVTAAGNTTSGAREGKHDDIVLAVAMGSWALEMAARLEQPHEGPVVYESGKVYESDRKTSLYGVEPGKTLTAQETARRIMQEEAERTAAFRRQWARWDEEDDAWEARRSAPGGNLLRGAPGRDDSWIW